MKAFIGLLICAILTSAGCSNPSPVAPTLAIPVTHPASLPVEPYIWGGPWEAECYARHLVRPTCGDEAVAVAMCVKHQNGSLVTGYSWECTPNSQFPKRGL